jgi:hypothetical protein
MTGRTGHPGDAVSQTVVVGIRPASMVMVMDGSGVRRTAACHCSRYGERYNHSQNAMSHALHLLFRKGH